MTVRVAPLVHRGKECIGLYFESNAKVQVALQRDAGAKWSMTQRCWYVPMGRDSYERVKKALAGLVSVEEGALRKYVAERRAGRVKPSGKLVQGVHSAQRIGAVNAGVLPALRQQLVLRAYSPSTIRTYINEVSAFLGTIGETDAGLFTVQRLRDYLQYCFETLQLSENTLHSRINALKFYYEQVLGRDKFFWEIPRPKKPMQLPKVLNEDELARLFNALPNRKHKAILFTAYSAGLRVSEVVNLKISDIDSGRMQIHVRGAKGKKDRMVNLSVLLLDILREYIKTYRPAPKEYLFESEQTGMAYPVRTVQEIFGKARRMAGISKEVGIHSLRHSFATHLLEKGTDIRYIKDILGHFNIKTTERYLHVSRKSLVNIISPLDDLWKRKEIDW